VTPDYLRVMGIPLLDGRFVDDHDRFDTEPVVVVDDNLAGHAFGRSDVVGRYLWVSAMGPSPLRIVGVVGHVRHWGLASDDQSRVRDQMYYPFAQVPLRLLRTFSGFMSIALRTAVSSGDIVEPLRRELRGTAADQALYDVHTMEQLVGASLARQRFLALLFAVFGGVSLVLATVGVYGVLAYLTRQRTAEIAVRMALGATRADIMRLVVGQSAALLATGVAIGTSGAWAAARVLHRLVAGVGPADPLTFSVMTAALIVAALLASALPARRAGQVAPIQALRAD
jgi:putative ABC transport system permease protein